MKRVKMLISIAAAAMVVGAISCQKEETPVYKESVSSEVLAKIHNLGLSTQDVIKTDEGYIVEGDILLTNERLDACGETKSLIVGNVEQYRTTNLVTNLPRVITVSLASNMPSNFGPALDEALARYNVLNLQITFQRVSSNGNISITKGPFWWNLFGILGQGGFPTANGDPYNSIMMNTSAFSKANQQYLATVLAHEIGHNIGFRHTDYMDRSYSCGGQATNEGASDVGAIIIPGTPSTPEAGSWMLSCSDGSNRPFTANDIIALDYLY